MQTLQNATAQLTGIIERNESGFTILSPANGPVLRRVLYVNGYGGYSVWSKVRDGEMPGHHLWGTLELVRKGYEVALAEPIPDFYLWRRPFPHDLRLFRFIKSWLGKDGIVYCGHNKLFWLPFLAGLGAVRSPIVSLLYSREPLDFGRHHRGVIALTPSARDQAAKLAPQAKLIHLGWGVDPDFFPVIDYNPERLLHCGIAGRDFGTLSAASFLSRKPLTIISAWPLNDLKWPGSVTIIDGGKGDNSGPKKVSYQELINSHYANSAAVLITSSPDPDRKHAFGFTNLIEALALGRPIIMTKTGALSDEIDVEAQGCGLTVPAADPRALAAAMNEIMADLTRARKMAAQARRLCEEHYNIQRYARELHQFFENL